MSNEKRIFTTPVARLVQGSVYTAVTKDIFGQPRVIKSGPDAGKPDPQYFFSVAIPKEQGLPWGKTKWGAILVEVAMDNFGKAIADSATFH